MSQDQGSQYHIFTAQRAIEYAREFGGVSDSSTLVEAEEIGDGNLNLVFKIYDTSGVSRVVVKQALPYVRCVGESWPLTIDRARLEARTLVEHYKLCPEHTVHVTHFDPELAVIVMEDLSDHKIWRGELVSGAEYPQAANQLGVYLAQTLFYTSDLYLHPHRKKELVAEFMNPEMCEITEDLFFNDPYMVHERNNYSAALEADVAALREHAALKVAVAKLKARFFSHAEALLHGDLHSGSIFVKEGSLKVIDAEFGYFGPIGFDVGTAIGNILLNVCGLPGLMSAQEAAQARERRLADIEALWESFAGRFKSLAERETRDIALGAPGYVEAFLGEIWRDTVGFAGTELIRRTVGLAHVADLESIEDEETRDACVRQAIKLGEGLILSAHFIKSPEALTAYLNRP